MAGTNKYRLPTEAEWEYAARAGSNTRYCFGNEESELRNYAWYEVNSGGRTHRVGRKKPNAWGLYDMHGNVWEWCEDWKGNYPGGHVTDPKGPFSGKYRVLRGGSWYGLAWPTRSAYRSWLGPDLRDNGLGFRVAWAS
jgi:formylglycine-generating enzyme required for sulfatase activity